MSGPSHPSAGGLLELRGTRKVFPSRRAGSPPVDALGPIDEDIRHGEFLAIVGPSGCGKSTLLSLISGLDFPTAGHIRLNGQMIKGAQSELGIVFQKDLLLPWRTTIDNVLLQAELRDMNMAQARARAMELLETVGLKGFENFYPHELSGGMRQRIVIAIALMCDPDLLIADEPTTALDVTIQAQILALFADIQARTGVAIMLITHDLGVVAGIADRVTVMYAGQCVETADVHTLFSHPAHPYTQALLASVPRLDMPAASLKAIAGQPPDLFAPPAGCAFAARCAHALRVCPQIEPPVTGLSDQGWVRCWLQDPRAPRPA